MRPIKRSEETLEQEKIREFDELLKRQQIDFTWEQQALRGLFGGGIGTFWGLEDSGTGVKLNHDLNPNIDGQMDGTINLFGGRRGDFRPTSRLFFR